MSEVDKNIETKSPDFGKSRGKVLTGRDFSAGVTALAMIMGFEEAVEERRKVSLVDFDSDNVCVITEDEIQSIKVMKKGIGIGQ